MTARPLYTIGYERAALTDVLCTLQRARVAVLIDVRQVAWSRRREFSTQPLAEALARRGIAYRHLPGLGNPKPGRDAARAGDGARYQAIYAAQLASADGQADLARAVVLAAEAPVCLMCYERDPARCHRSIVAARVAEAASLRIEALVAEGAGAVSPSEAAGRLGGARTARQPQRRNLAR